MARWYHRPCWAGWRWAYVSATAGKKTCCWAQRNNTTTAISALAPSCYTNHGSNWNHLLNRFEVLYATLIQNQVDHAWDIRVLRPKRAGFEGR